MFRKESIDSQRQKLHGDVIVMPTVLHWKMTLLFALVFSIGLLLLVFGEYPRQETVRGWLEPQAGVVKIFPGQVGRVTKVHVKDGQWVEKGQAVATIEPQLRDIDGTSVTQHFLDNLSTQREEIASQLPQLQAMHRLELQKIEMNVAAIQRDLELLESQANSISEQIVISTQQWQVAKEFHAKRIGTSRDVDDTRLRLLQLEQTERDLRRERQHKRLELQQLSLERKLLPKKTESQMVSLRTDLARLERQVIEAQAQQEQLLVSPVAGKLSGLQIRVGQQANTSLPLALVSPNGDELFARLLVPARAIGFTKLKQTVSLRYDAFPYQKFGVHAGQLQSIAESATLPSEIQDLPFELRESVYQVTVKLNSQEINTYQERSQLRPGMTLQAEITLENRSLLEWLLEPVAALRGRV